MTNPYDRLENTLKNVHADRPAVKLDQAWQNQVMAAVRADQADLSEQSFFSPWFTDILSSKIWLAGNLAVIVLAVTLFLTPEKNQDIITLVWDNSLTMLTNSMHIF